jgi:hypothetical protein
MTVTLRIDIMIFLPIWNVALNQLLAQCGDVVDKIIIDRSDFYLYAPTTHSEPQLITHK